MKTIEVLSVGLRLVGIYGVLKGIHNIAMTYSSLFMYQAQFPDDNSYYFVAVGFVVAYFTAALVLIIFPVRIARFLTPKSDGPPLENSLQGSDFQVGALIILGIYMVANSLPMVFQNGVLAWQAFAMPEHHNNTGGRVHLIYTLSRAIELSIGIYLCLQSKGLVNLIYKIRELGAK